MRISPEIEQIYSQLCWMSHRTCRIVGAVSAHFGRESVEKILRDNHLKAERPSSSELGTLLDERSPEEFVAALAFDLSKNEALLISALRRHVSIYQEHVDEQILYGARTTGQDAGRNFLSRFKPIFHGRKHLPIPEAVQAVFELTYSGIPADKCHFLCLRSMGSSTVYFVRSPHLIAWKEAEADPKFLYKVKAEWINGILDILSPETAFVTSQAIEHGNSFGLAHFYQKGHDAGV